MLSPDRSFVLKTLSKKEYFALSAVLPQCAPAAPPNWTDWLRPTPLGSLCGLCACPPLQTGEYSRVLEYCLSALGRRYFEYVMDQPETLLPK